MDPKAPSPWLLSPLGAKKSGGDTTPLGSTDRRAGVLRVQNPLTHTSSHCSLNEVTLTIRFSNFVRLRLHYTYYIMKSYLTREVYVTVPGNRLT